MSRPPWLPGPALVEPCPRDARPGGRPGGAFDATVPLNQGGIPETWAPSPRDLVRLAWVIGERYRVGPRVGIGGGAAVYRASDLKHGREVAIKILRMCSRDGRRRFAREIGIVACLRHPNIVPLHDSGEEHGRFFFVMPFISGGTLQQRIAEEGRIPIRLALRLVAEIGDALGLAHRQGVVHGDVKPANVLLDSEHAVVADFGVARLLCLGADAMEEGPHLLGTPSYMSPEHIEGIVDERSDVYSLACLLFEMLAGIPPFVGSSARAVCASHLIAEAPSVRRMNRKVPRRVAAALTRALAKDPEDRFSTVDSFLGSL